MENRTYESNISVEERTGRNLEMSAEAAKLKRNLTREAVSMALKGKWERATEVNRAILDRFEDDVEAMNRLGKALMELGDYSAAKKVFDRVVHIAPYNNIAKKNAARLEQLESTPLATKQARKGGAAPQLFIEESGKSGTTLLRKPADRQVIARLTPSDPANLVVEENSITVQNSEGDYLGQIEPKLARRLIRLMYGGNKYDAAILGINERGVSIIVRETYRDRTMNEVCSFPSRTSDEHRVYLGGNLVQYIGGDSLEDDDEPAIDEEAMDTGWNDGE